MDKSRYFSAENLIHVKLSLSLSQSFDFYVNIQIFRMAPLLLNEVSLDNRMLHASLTYFFLVVVVNLKDIYKWFSNLEILT